MDGFVAFLMKIPLDFLDLHPINDMLDIVKDFSAAVFQADLQFELLISHNNIFRLTDKVIEKGLCFSDFNYIHSVAVVMGLIVRCRQHIFIFGLKVIGV